MQLANPGGPGGQGPPVGLGVWEEGGNPPNKRGSVVAPGQGVRVASPPGITKNSATQKVTAPA